MFDPKQFEAMRSQIKGEDMKRASEMMAGMSSDDLQKYLGMMGMNGVSPDFIKSAASNMSRMDPNTLENMKNMMPNNPNQVPAQTQPQTSPSNDHALDQIVTIKNSGNELFRQGRYAQAAVSYREAIKLLEGNALSKEAVDLEIACRSNLANCEAKEGNYGQVIEQCKKILVFGENGKAFYRYGHALYAQGKQKEALDYLTKAKRLMASDANVINLYEEVKRKAEETRSTVEEIDEEVKILSQPEVKSSPEPIQNKPKDRGINIEEILEEEKTVKPAAKPSVVIKEKPEVKLTEQPKPAEVPAMNLPNLSSERIQKGMEDLKTMSSDDISRMISNMKNMDPRFMQNIFKSQGIDMPAEEIQKMVSMMTPEAVDRMKSMGAPTVPSVATESTGTDSTPTPMPSMNPMGMPGFSADNINMALNNPAMIQMMSQMLSTQLGRSPGEIETVLSCFRRFFNLCMSFVNGYRFLTAGNRKYITYGGVVLGIAYLLGFI